MFHASAGFSGSEPLRQRIAVIGSGVSGLSAAWLLAQTNDVVLYEADTRLGGHANTVDVPGTGPVDTGFIVYNEQNYPNFSALMSHLGVESLATKMSFSASLDRGGFEYSGEGLGGLLAQKRNAFRPRFWALVRDVLRFYREAPDVLARPDLQQLTLDEYLLAQRYSQSFIDGHLLPLAAAIWSSSASEIRSYPLLAFVRFFESHNLLQLWDRPKWRTVKGGSRQYVSSLMAQFAGTVRLSTPVATIRRDAGGVTIIDAKGNPDRFDQVLVASHADQALRMLEQPSSDERDLLGAFAYTNNTAVLHADARYMPRRRRAWSSWNYMAIDHADARHPLCVSYWMNQLHGLEGRDLFVTLNPPQAPQQEIARFHYAHPVFDAKAIAAQENLWRVQGQNRTWFAGAYFGRGFHEDGLQAGLAAAEAMGSLPRPWSVRDPSGRITLAPPAALAA